MGGGDIVVMFKDTPAARALITYLATPEAATIWASRGGFSSPNKNVQGERVQDPINRATAIALARAPSSSASTCPTSQPAAFGSTTGQGEWKLFQDFLKNPKNVNGTASALESSAAKAYK